MSTCAALWPTSIDTCVCVYACDQEYLRFFSLPAPLPHLVTPHSRYFKALWAISVCTWPGSSPERTHLSRRRKYFCLELENKSGREERCAGRRWKSGTRLAKREERCEEEEEGEEGTDLPVFPLGFLLFLVTFNVTLRRHSGFPCTSLSLKGTLCWLSMPRAFLVKKANISPGKRNWSELPDHERGDVYIPGESTAVMSHFCCCLKRKRNVGDSVYGLVFGRLYARICGFLLFVCLFVCAVCNPAGIPMWQVAGEGVSGGDCNGATE